MLFEISHSPMGDRDRSVCDEHKARIPSQYRENTGEKMGECEVVLQDRSSGLRILLPYNIVPY